IDETPPDYKARLDALTERFSQLPAEALFEFYHQYVGVLVEALRPELRAATGVITDYWQSWSDERFNYFVFWLILCGRRTFEAALAAPETLADVVEPHDWGVLPEGLHLLHLVDEAYRNRTGRNDFEEEFRRGHPPAPCDDHGEEVLESEEELRRRFP